MRTLEQQLVQYARYHRDRRNIATHFIGIPMIVLAVAVLLARLPLGSVAGLPLSVATLAVLASGVYYLLLDLRYGLLMSALLALCLVLAEQAATWAPTAGWALGVGLFVLGWIIQFIGHVFEGRKPAFVDDLVGLIIGPLFVLAEAGFALGCRSELQARIDEQAGPLRRGPAPAGAQA